MSRRLGLVLTAYYLAALVVAAIPPTRCDGHGRAPHPAAGLARCVDTAGSVWLCRDCWHRWNTTPTRRPRR